MSDANLYDKINYDNGPITTSASEYDSWDFWVNFQNGFKIPTSFVRNIMFEYLSPIASTYSESRKSKSEINAYNIQKTYWWIVIRGEVTGTSRSDLIENIEHFKMKCRNRMDIVVKDWGVERIAKCVVDDISFDENHYNVTYMRFEVTLSFRDYIAYNQSTHLEYLSNSWVTKVISFYNNWLETDLIWIINVNSGSNIDLTLNVNGVNLDLENLDSWDTVTVDTENVSVKVNWTEIVFWWILTKLEEWTNTLIMTMSWSWNYDFHIYYKKTIS